MTVESLHGGKQHKIYGEEGLDRYIDIHHNHGSKASWKEYANQQLFYVQIVHTSYGHTESADIGLSVAEAEELVTVLQYRIDQAKGLIPE